MSYINWVISPRKVRNIANFTSSEPVTVDVLVNPWWMVRLVPDKPGQTAFAPLQTVIIISISEAVA